jgi:ketosteroid isomerase-like protein
MGSHIKGAAALALLVLLTGEAPSAAATTPQETVARFHDALRRGDAAAVAAMLDEKALIVEAGETETKAEYLEGHLAADITFAGAVTETVLRQDLDRLGEISWVTTLRRVAGNVHGHDIRVLTAETLILRRFDDHWRIVQAHWSSRAEKS